MHTTIEKSESRRVMNKYRANNGQLQVKVAKIGRTIITFEKKYKNIFGNKNHALKAYQADDKERFV